MDQVNDNTTEYSSERALASIGVFLGQSNVLRNCVSFWLNEVLNELRL